MDAWRIQTRYASLLLIFLFILFIPAQYIIVFLGFGSSMGHISNLLIATALSNGTSDECQWYCICYLTDVTLGTFLSISILSLIESALVSSNSPSIFKFGEYGNPPSMCIWVVQLIVWLSIIITTKCLIVSFLYLSANMLILGSTFIFIHLETYPRIELVIVMICIPFVFNILAFWVTDRWKLLLTMYSLSLIWLLYFIAF